MTTPNRIVFQATGKPFEKGDYRCLPTGEISKCGAQSTADMWNGMQEIAYRRIDAPADSRLPEGMTLLDYFAAAALESNMREAVAWYDSGNACDVYERAAKGAYRAAAAMLAEKKRREGAAQ